MTLNLQGHQPAGSIWVWAKARPYWVEVFLCKKILLFSDFTSHSDLLLLAFLVFIE